MKKYLRIQNDGEIELEAFFLIGASSKRNQNGKIGFFGSGLKYGLAVFLRNNIDIKIYSGINEVKISTIKKQFRGESFDQIVINGIETGLTVQMGIDWEPWFAIREIYSNSLDENESKIEIVEESETIPDFDKTRFYVEITKDIQKCLDKWDEYFSEKRQDLVFRNDDMTVFNGGDDYIIYRKGIQCHKSPYKSLFHYDVKDIEINESRTLKNACDSTWQICEIVKSNANKKIIRRIYDNQNEKYIENQFRWEYGYFNEDWLNVIGGRRVIISEVSGHYVKEQAEGNCIILNKCLANALHRQFGERINIIGKSDNFGEFHIIEKTKKQEQYIKECCDFLKLNGYEIVYDINVVIFDNKKILGQAQGTTILLSDRVFEEGKKKLCECIFEEYIHIKYQYNDCSREMQDFLFNRVITFLEQKSEVYL